MTILTEDNGQWKAKKKYRVVFDVQGTVLLIVWKQIHPKGKWKGFYSLA